MSRTTIGLSASPTGSDRPNPRGPRSTQLHRSDPQWHHHPLIPDRQIVGLDVVRGGDRGRRNGPSRVPAGLTSRHTAAPSPDEPGRRPSFVCLLVSGAGAHPLYAAAIPARAEPVVHARTARGRPASSHNARSSLTPGGRSVPPTRQSPARLLAAKRHSARPSLDPQQRRQTNVLRTPSVAGHRPDP